MARRFRRIALALGVVLVTGAVVLVIAERPGLQDDADSVDRAWKPLAAPLATRYTTLTALAAALDAAGAKDRDVTVRLHHELSNWDLLKVTTDLAAQARTANNLEGLEARVRATVAAGPDKLKNDPAVTKGLADFAAATPPASVIKDYNQAVLAYEQDRDGFWSRLVADLDGYDTRSTFQLAPS